MYCINWVLVGGNSVSSSIPTGLNCAAYSNYVDFEGVREAFKTGVLAEVDTGCPCVSDCNILVLAYKIEDGEIVRYKRFTIPYTKILRW